MSMPLGRKVRTVRANGTEAHVSVIGLTDSIAKRRAKRIVSRRFKKSSEDLAVKRINGIVFKRVVIGLD